MYRPPVMAKNTAYFFELQTHLKRQSNQILFRNRDSVTTYLYSVTFKSARC